jgi:hypothetical protein
MIFVFLSACTSERQNNNPTRIINASGDIEEHFDTFDDLVNGSKVIVEVKVKDSETIVYGDLPFTISTAEVKQTIKGSYNKGDSIKILETGGKYYPMDKDNKKSKEEYELVFKGVKVMNSSDSYIVFLDEYVGPITENAFVIKGVYQGKFIVENNIVSQQTPDGHEKESYSGTSFDDFVKKVKGVSK